MVENVIQFPLERRLDTILLVNGPAEIVQHPAWKPDEYALQPLIDVMLPADVEPSE